MFFTKKHINKTATGDHCAIFTDFHSHILPRLDDGSKSDDETLQMLRASKQQGVKRIVATPHFYPHLWSPEKFLGKRERAMEDLVSAVTSRKAEGEEFPRVYVGAEVAYFSGISKCEWMEKLCLSGSRIILVEMPFERWSDAVLDELLDIKSGLDIIPVIAHIERYFPCQPREFIDELFGQDVLIQFNAESFLNNKTRKRALSLLEGGQIDFIGSDCHDLVSRAPNLGDACKIINKKLNNDALKKLNDFGDFVFADLTPLI